MFLGRLLFFEDKMEGGGSGVDFGELGEVKGGETVVRMCCMKKKLFSIKKKIST